VDDQPTERDSERRQATVLFADLSGFTAMSERMDPEDVTVVINRCFEMLETVVDRHGGHVDKYIGDCIMALFGVPRALEHAPRQAVNAAIEMRHQIRRLNEEEKLPVPLLVHIGINSGLVLAGQMGGVRKRDFTVMGDTVNVASRLKDAAPDGTVYVGPQTYRYTRDEFEYRPTAPLELKGKEQPLAAWELLSVHERLHRPSVVRSDRMIFSEMVGREAELRQIAERITRLATGEGGIVSVVGEAGLGKSRLLAEVYGLDAVRGVTVLQGRALSIGQSLSFHPFVDLLRQWAGIGEDDGEHEALARLERTVGGVLGEGAADVFPFVATLMGLRVTGAHAERIKGIEGEAMEKLILKSMRELLGRLAGARPLVLVFEDVHWADLSSLKLLEALLRLVADSPILFVLALRPEDQQIGPALLRLVRAGFAQRHLEIQLVPLDPRQCDTLIRNLLKLDDLPHAVRTLIAGKAEGNPFFIEEVLRSLIDEGVVEHHNGRFTVTARIGKVEIPGTIQEVIMARIDRLPEASRRLLQVASIIGRSANQRIIAAILAGDVELEWELSYLKKRQLVLERRVGEEVEYVFTHALAQETIYGSILQRTRKDLHLQVARSIEGLFAERLSDFYGMLAYHYSRADSVEKAEEYLFLAGDEAARSAASSEALHYFREASRLYFVIHGEGGDPRKKVILERNIGLALMTTGNLSESIDHFNRALEFLGEPVAKTPTAIAIKFAGDLPAVLLHLYAPPRRHRSAVGDEHYRDALLVRMNRTRAQSTSDTRRLLFDYFDSIRHMNRRDLRTVEEASANYAGFAVLFAYSGVSFGISRRVLRLAESLLRPDSTRDVFVLRAMRFVYDFLEGNWGDACAIDEALVEQALRNGQLWEANSYLGLDCERRMRRGEFAAARRRIDLLAQLSEAYGYSFAQSTEYSTRAFVLLEERRLPEARAAIERYYASRDEEVLKLLALGTRAKIEILDGDRDAAAVSLAKAGDLRRRLGRAQIPYHVSAYLMSKLLFDVTALEECASGGRRGDIRRLGRQARASARRALAIAARVARERTEAYRLAGRLWWALGRHERALAWWGRSITEGERLGARPEVARTCVDVAHRLEAGAPRHRLLAGQEAAVYRARGQAILEELELEWDLGQLGIMTGRVVTPLAAG